MSPTAAAIASVWAEAWNDFFLACFWMERRRPVRKYWKG